MIRHGRFAKGSTIDIATPVTERATPTKPELATGGAYAVWHWLLAHRWLTLAFVIIAGLALWQGYRLFAGTRVPVDAVARGDLVETVVASGHVETPYRVEIGSQMTGTVVSVAVREGQAVKAGQLLIALDMHELAAGVVQAQGAAAQAMAHMRQLRELTLPSALDTGRTAERNRKVS